VVSKVAQTSEKLDVQTSEKLDPYNKGNINKEVIMFVKTNISSPAKAGGAPAAENISEPLNEETNAMKKLSKPKQTGFGIVNKETKKPLTKKSEFPLSEFDKEQGLSLRSILIEHGSDLVTSGYKVSSEKSKGGKRPKRKYSRAATPETLAENFYLLRTERNVSEEEIMEVMEFLSKNFNGQYTPKVYASMDLYNKWERFRDAAERKESQGKDKWDRYQEEVSKASQEGYEMYLEEKERKEKQRNEKQRNTTKNGEDDFTREFSSILW